MSGKWHVGEERPNWPRDRGFDEYFGLIGGAANYFDIKKSKAEDAIRTMALNDEPWTPPEDGFYMTNAITDKAVEYVKKSGQEENPFFMYVAYTAPHWPLHALPEDIEKFIGKYTGGWDEVRETRYQRMLEMGILEESWALSPRDEEIPPWEEVTDKEKRDRLFAIYAAMIYRLDIGIGQIMDELEAQGKLENTLVMFVSDNGASSEYGVFGRDSRNNGVEIGGEDSYHTYGLSWSNASNTPFRENKKWTHEGGIATPFIASWPAVIKKGGTINRDVGHIVDVMATCIDVAGVEYPTEYNGNSIKSMEGRSLVPTLMGKQGAERGDLFWEHLGNRAARRGKWKLVAEKKGDWELYDMDSDRSELNDLSTEMPELRDELIQAWKSWAERVGVEHI